LDPNDENFKEELSKAHYNMGNIFFQRGEYQRAVVEFYQAVDLSPYDADTHYNLAFVSGEYLKDQETALKHYQWYLYLRPEAEDIDLVKEKMAAAKLSIRSRIDSPLDKDKGYENVVR
jgi:tetratricopeptide (TPR) repeat protein